MKNLIFFILFSFSVNAFSAIKYPAFARFHDDAIVDSQVPSDLNDGSKDVQCGVLNELLGGLIYPNWNLDYIFTTDHYFSVYYTINFNLVMGHDLVHLTNCRPVGFVYNDRTIESIVNNGSPYNFDGMWFMNIIYDFQVVNTCLSDSSISSSACSCPVGSRMFFSRKLYTTNKVHHFHDQCEADKQSAISWGFYDESEIDSWCNGSSDFNFFTRVYRVVYCEVVPEISPDLRSRASEDTLKTTNSLVSESNSKLGAIATTNAINTSLLDAILGSINGLNFSFNSVFSVISSSVVETSPELKTNFFDLTSISVFQSLKENESFNCPANFNFSFLNSNYSISYAPFCSFALRIRVVVISAARVGAAVIILGAL